MNEGVGWRRVKLKEVCREITVGHVGPMVNEYVADGIPFLRSQNIQPFRLDLASLKYITPVFHARLRKSALAPGDVAVVRTGYPGTACVIPASVPVSNCADLVIMRTGEQVDPRYLVALLNSTWGKGQIAGNLVGVAQQHFNVSAAKEMEIGLPPLPTQRKIADILSAYDDLIENNTRRIAILEEMAQRLYQEWFVHFRYPGHENVPLVDSDLGPIPKGWEVKRLAEVATIVMGQSPKSEFYNLDGNGLPFHQGVTDFGPRFPSNRVYCTVEIRIAEPEDILFSVRAPVGRMNLATDRIVIGRGLSAIRSKSGQQAFLFQKMIEVFAEEDLMGGGSIFKSVTKDDVYGIKLLVPSRVVIEQAVLLLQPIFRVLKVHTDQSALLRSSRDLLLSKLLAPNAFSGSTFNGSSR